jgi:antitoxin YqcF
VKVSDAQREIARHAASAFGGEPEIRRHWNEDRTSYVAVLGAPDTPVDGVTSWATIGLSDATSSSQTPGLELVGACASAYPEFEESLLRAASIVSERGEVPEPGTLLLDVMVQPEHGQSPMRHCLLVPPFLWDGDVFGPAQFAGRTVVWLQLVPISDSEREYADREGAAALDELFEHHAIDIYDASRQPVA